MGMKRMSTMLHPQHALKHPRIPLELMKLKIRTYARNELLISIRRFLFLLEFLIKPVDIVDFCAVFDDFSVVFDMGYDLFGYVVGTVWAEAIPIGTAVSFGEA